MMAAEPARMKFACDAEGHFWEKRGTVGGRDVYMPAPIWAGNINPYLFEGPTIFIESQPKPLCDVPALKLGSIPRDGGNLILSDDEKNELLSKEPQAEKFIRPFMMGREFINNIPRWCLWLKGAEPADIRKCPRVLERIEKVREFRQNSPRAATRKLADTPMLFAEIRETSSHYLAVPGVSSGDRRYIPIGWLSKDVIAGNKLYVCENSTLYQFGVLNSSVHMAWVRCISGRLKSDYSYSNTLDYNAFVWPSLPADSPKRLRIERTAQGILDARSLYPSSSLADLYDERTMPPELRKAHRDNDAAVMEAYGFTRHYEDDRQHDEDIVIRLMYMYKELTGCKEYTQGYPNYRFFMDYYGYDDDDEE